MRALEYIRNVSTLRLDAAACTGCGMCAVVCPHRIFTIAARKAVVGDRDFCMECGACMMNCPAGAVTVGKGVGCATAVIAGWIQGGPPTCGCDSGPTCCS